MKSILITALLFLLTSCLSAPQSESMSEEEMWARHNTTVFEHYRVMMKSDQRAFKLQQVQTVGVAIMVFVIVVAGLRMSYLQFRSDKEGNRSSVTTIKIGAGTVEVRSPVIGVIILALSLLFFQVYVSEVYKIRPLHAPVVEQNNPE